MKRVKQFHLVGLVSLLILGFSILDFGFWIFDSVSSNPKYNTAPTSISNPQSAIRNPQSGGRWINLRDGPDLPTAYTGAAGLKQVLEQGLAQPLALASGDFDEDGVPDLVCGYAGPDGGILTLYRGNIDSTWFSQEKQKAKGKGQKAKVQTSNQQLTTNDAFRVPARVFEVPGAPEFLGTGDFDADDHLDVLATTRGSNVLYWLPGNGQGSFDPVEEIELPGAVTALVTGGMNRRDGLMDVVVGINGPEGPELLVFEWLGSEPHVFALPAEATALALGQLDEDYRLDLAVAAGRELLIVQGSTDLNLCHSFPFTIRSITLGNFIWDEEHRTEIALLSDNGSVHLLERREGEYGSVGVWADAELSLNAHTPTRPHAHSLLVRAKVSSLPTDDLVVIDAVNHQLHFLSAFTPSPFHPLTPSPSPHPLTLSPPHPFPFSSPPHPFTPSPHHGSSAHAPECRCAQ